MDTSHSSHLNFLIYLNFAQNLLIFYIPVLIGVICSIMIKEFKTTNSSKRLTSVKKIRRAVVWSFPADFLICIINILLADKLSETSQMVIFAAAFFVGMVGEDLANMFVSMRLWIKVCKEILKDLGGAIGKVDITKSISDAMEDEFKENNKENKKENNKNNK